jgi:hypothetical protein
VRWTRNKKRETLGSARYSTPCGCARGEEGRPRIECGRPTPLLLLRYPQSVLQAQARGVQDTVRSRGGRRTHI